MMIEKRIWLLLLVIVVVGGSVFQVGSWARYPTRHSRLDTVIGKIPEERMLLPDLLEFVAGECRLEYAFNGAAVPEVNSDGLGGSARSLLNTTLPSHGYQYVLEGKSLKVMSPEAMGCYFEQEAVTRIYEVEVTSRILQKLLSTPDVVSTLGSLEIYPDTGLVAIRDLPGYVAGLEKLLRRSESVALLL